MQPFPQSPHDTLVSSATVGTALHRRPREPDDAEARVEQRRRGVRPAALAALGYLVWAIFITWPLLLHPGTWVYGGGGDLWASLAQSRELVGHNPFLPGRLSDLAAPEGLAISYSLDIATWPSTTALYLLTAVAGEVAANNLFVISGYVLSGVALYLLALRFTDRKPIAFLAGFIFAFSPFAVAKGAGHPQFVHGWPLVLLAWRMLEFNDRPTSRNGILAGLAAAFAMSFTPYYVLFGGVMLAVFLVVGLVLAVRAGSLKSYAISAGITCAIVLATLAVYAGIATTDDAAPIRTSTLAQLWFAEPLQYLVPHPNNILFGDWATSYRQRHWGISGEAEIYLGVSVLVLALAGVAVLIRGVRDRRMSAGTLALPLLVVAGLAFSLPAHVDVFGLSVKSPTGYVFSVTTQFRIFVRLVEVIMLALAVLAAIGATSLLRRLTGRAAGIAIGALFVIVALDLWAKPPAPSAKVPAPAVYTRLAAEPLGIVAEYPLLPAEAPVYDAMLYQKLHGHPILNGYASGSLQQDRALSALSNLRDPRVPERLALLGVRYVLIPDAARTGGAAIPVGGVPGLTPLFSGDQRTIYRVTARPARSFSFWSGDAYTPDGVPPIRWLRGTSVNLQVDSGCRRCRATAEVTVTSFVQGRTATLSAGSHKVSAPVPPGAAVRLSLDVPMHLSERFHLEAEPGPQSVAQALHTADKRTIGLGILSQSVRIRR
jgi:hypothetical protein